MKINKSAKKGFTLIELIVVMAVILVLSSFLIPKFKGYRNKAIRLKAIDTGRQIYSAAFVSYMENDNKYSKELLKSTINELVGSANTSVSECSDEAATISYKVNNKQYSLKVDMNKNRYVIREGDDSSNKQIYPPDNSVQAANTINNT
ncbi:type II secretion system protein [Clostridium sp. ZS2-4]|uniref:type II secretion system protein n=1 Tax=Clostridium sp. ZS2-4 TaxID=2987703 RepID=UPI00227AC552|nr:type II secretion system protein [Clostridium sp. ZS2-4]MCY6354057.1 type II secretion system protein [Clostridium sp. ZS2-4]